MVTGVCIRFRERCVYAPCSQMTAEQLYYKLWLSCGQIICCPEATGGAEVTGEMAVSEEMRN